MTADTPGRARKRSLSRTERHHRASQSRSLGLINWAIRAHPARKPAAAFERGLTASQLSLLRTLEVAGPSRYQEDLFIQLGSRSGAPAETEALPIADVTNGHRDAGPTCPSANLGVLAISTARLTRGFIVSDAHYRYC